MERNSCALPTQEEYRVTSARRWLIFIALAASFLVTALVATSLLLPDYPLAWIVTTGLFVGLWFKMFCDIPGRQARLILNSQGIFCSDWPFESIAWRDLREVELFGGAEGAPSRICLKLNKHYRPPGVGERMRMQLSPADRPEIVEIVADAYALNVWELHERIATWLACYNPDSYPAKRLARGLSAGGLFTR